MKKFIIWLAVLSTISKFLGFFREIVLSYFYGASEVSDAYLISITIPAVIFAFVGAALSTSYIPLFTSAEKESGTEGALRFSNNVVNFLLIFACIVAIAGLTFTKEIVKVFASGFSGQTLSLAVFFTRVSIGAVFFTGLTYIFKSFLEVRSDFIPPACIGFPYNLIVISSIVLGASINDIFLPLGFVLAAASQLLLLLPFAYKRGYRYYLTLDKSDPYIRKMVFLALPVILGVSVSQINVLVDRTLASRIVEGGISALNYASRLNGFNQGIFVMSVATVMFPAISKMASTGNVVGLKGTLAKAINLVSIIVIPLTVGAMVFAVPVIKFLFGRGAFDLKAVDLTSTALFYYAVGMTAVAYREILSRVFYAMHDTKTPMVNGAIAVVVNIILNIILSRFLGIGGLALATSISAILAVGLMFISLRKKIGPFGIKNIVNTLGKITLASAVMGVFAKFVFDFALPKVGNNWAFLAATVAGASLYGVMICFMKIKEVGIIIDEVKVMFGKMLR